MKILLDENVPQDIIRVLRKAGHDVEHINYRCKGMKDADVLEYAYKSKRTIISIDSDFCQFKVREHYGIIKVSGKLPEFDKPLLQLLQLIKGTSAKNVYYQINENGAFKEIKKYGKKRKTFLKNFQRTKVELEYFQKT